MSCPEDARLRRKGGALASGRFKGIRSMKWREPKPEKPKPCSRCRRGFRVVGKLCGHCYAEDVRRFEEWSRRSAAGRDRKSVV